MPLNRPFLLFLLFLLLLVLGGCATQERVTTVSVPVAQRCAVGERVVPPENEYGRMPPPRHIDAAIIALKADRARWSKAFAELDAATAGCW